MLDTATRAAPGWLSAGGRVSEILTAVELRIVDRNARLEAKTVQHKVIAIVTDGRSGGA
jgi:hypothetical protein